VGEEAPKVKEGESSRDTQPPPPLLAMGEIGKAVGVVVEAAADSLESVEKGGGGLVGVVDAGAATPPPPPPPVLFLLRFFFFFFLLLFPPPLPLPPPTFTLDPILTPGPLPNPDKTKGGRGDEVIMKMSE